MGVECAGCDDEAIAIAWPDGHRTRYRSSEIHRLISRPRLDLHYWDCRFQPQEFDFQRFLHHDRTALRSGGRRHLQDAYFEHDNARNHLTLLRRAGRI